MRVAGGSEQRSRVMVGEGERVVRLAVGVSV